MLFTTSYDAACEKHCVKVLDLQNMIWGLQMTVLFRIPRETDSNDRKFLIVYPYSEFYSQDLNTEKTVGEKYVDS